MPTRWTELRRLYILFAYLLCKAALFCHSKKESLATFLADKPLITKHHITLLF
jgi:hypothetical protein